MISNPFQAGRDLNLSAGDKAAGGSQSFGDILSPRPAGGSSGDSLFSAAPNNAPLYIGGGLVALTIAGFVVIKAVK